MAGRSRTYRHHPQNLHEDPRRGPPPIPLEEELELQGRDIRRIMSQNRRTIDENVTLQRELTALKDEIRRLNQVVPKMHVEREARKRELIERGLKMEAELRLAEPLRADVVHLRADLKKLSAQRHDLSSQVQTLTKDVGSLQSENKQIGLMKSDVDTMRKELADARRAYELERKGNEELVEQNRSMEKNIISMAREIENLRAELATADMWPKDFGGYGVMNTNAEMRYLSGPYGDMYGGGSSWLTYDKRAPPRR